MTHICVSKLTIIGSDNGLSPDGRQAIIWTNAGLLLIGPLGTNFSEILIEILKFSFKKMRLNVSSAKRRPFCPGLNVLMCVMITVSLRVALNLTAFKGVWDDKAFIVLKFPLHCVPILILSDKAYGSKTNNVQLASLLTRLRNSLSKSQFTHIYVLTSMCCQQATGLDAWASRVKCPARFVSHLHDICIYMSCL